MEIICDSLAQRMFFTGLSIGTGLGILVSLLTRWLSNTRD